MELHSLEGTRSEVGVKRVPGTNRRATSRTAKTTLVGGRGELEVPVGLDVECAAAWLELREQCAAVLDLADAAMLETAAVALGRFRQARAAITRNGLMVPGRFDVDVENPALKVERDAAAMLHRAMVELGIGPSARARFSGLGAQGKTAASELGGLAELIAISGGAAT